MPFARCSVCEDIINLGQALELNQPVTCPTCLSNLRVVSIEPPELEEANRRQPRPPRYHSASRNPQAPGHVDERNRYSSSGAGFNRNPGTTSNTISERRPFPPLPPNPDKQVNGKRAQKWEKSHQSDDEIEIEEFEELEVKLTRNRSGKGKRAK